MKKVLIISTLAALSASACRNYPMPQPLPPDLEPGEPFEAPPERRIDDERLEYASGPTPKGNS